MKTGSLKVAVAIGPSASKNEKVASLAYRRFRRALVLDIPTPIPDCGLPPTLFRIFNSSVPLLASRIDLQPSAGPAARNTMPYRIFHQRLQNQLWH